MIKKLISFILILFIVLNSSFINSLAVEPIPDDSFTFTANETEDGYIYAQATIALDSAALAGNLELNDYYFEMKLGYWWVYLADTAGGYTSTIDLYENEYDLIRSITINDFNSYYGENIIEEEYQSYIKMDLIDIFNNFEVGYNDADERYSYYDTNIIVITLFFKEQYKDQLANFQYEIVANDADIFLLTKSYTIRKWSDNNIIVTYDVASNLFANLSSPFTSDYPESPNIYVEYEFLNWTVKDSSIVVVNDDSLVDYADTLGFVDVQANYNLVSIYGGVSDNVPATEGRIPALFTALNLDSTTGYILVYIVFIIAAIILALLYSIPTTALIIILIFITGMFNYLGFLPLLISIIIYFAFTVVFMFLIGGESSE